jgi:hypothetical protein
MVQDRVKVKVKLKQSLYKPGQVLRVAGSWGSQISKQLALAAFTPQKIFLVLISVRGWVDPKALVWSEELCQWKFPLTLSGIEAATFRLAAQCLNQLCHCMALLNVKYKIIIHSYQHKNKSIINHSAQYIIQYLQWQDNTLICDKNSSVQ